MRIVICGSNAFREKMIEFKYKLNDMGHEGIIHPDYEAFDRGEKQEVWNQIQEDHAKAKRENNYIGWYHDAIVNSDAIVVLNYDKKGIANYIGGNTLMEIAFAHTNGKKVFLMNPVPQEVSYSDEIGAMYDEILYGDLSKINKIKMSCEMSLKEVADEANKIEDDLGLNIDDVLHKVTQEVGEFNDAVQKFRGRYCRSNILIEDVKGELGDVIFNLSFICNRIGINPDEFSVFAKETLEKFKRRKEDYRK
ncbi:MAG: MazG nucleotide pyrophosphohydrolase domain-containing protein [archaeon]